ncbi:MAG: hypothetical protein EPN93_00715 [Spirochaetes bacterium]|nr:MAG: hypothetical protein EPN93_00715 [Spirochaetota bacterium]
MLVPGKMKIADCTCLLCGSRLGLTISSVVTGDNRGACPMCGEPFLVSITREEMEQYIEAEEERPLREGR